MMSPVGFLRQLYNVASAPNTFFVSPSSYTERLRGYEFIPTFEATFPRAFNVTKTCVSAAIGLRHTFSNGRQKIRPIYIKEGRIRSWKSR